MDGLGQFSFVYIHVHLGPSRTLLIHVVGLQGRATYGKEV